MLLLTHTTMALSDLRAPGGVLLERFQEAYDHYNRALFKNQLPTCVLIVARKRGAYGYFWNGKWEKKGRPLHEIALNPDWLNSRPLGEVLSTLVHEMVHLWQHEFGKPSKVTHHNREWAKKMKALGLHPSSTGQPGGKETGMRVSHYIVEKGPFAAANAELLASGFELPVNTTMRFGFGMAPKAPKYRVTVRCPECRMSALTKEGNKMLCGEHGLVMLTEDEMANGGQGSVNLNLLTKIKELLSVGATLAETETETEDDETT